MPIKPAAPAKTTTANLYRPELLQEGDPSPQQRPPAERIQSLNELTKKVVQEGHRLQLSRYLGLLENYFKSKEDGFGSDLVQKALEELEHLA